MKDISVVEKEKQEDIEATFKTNLNLNYERVKKANNDRIRGLYERSTDMNKDFKLHSGFDK